MNGLKFIRIRCNISLSELAEALKVSRQHVSAWENGTKRISESRLNQLSKYFGVDKKYFGEITKEDRKMIVSKELYRRQDSEKECFCFAKPSDVEDAREFRAFHYPDFGESLDEQMIRAKKRKKATMDDIDKAMDYYGLSDKIMNKIIAINRGCRVYGALTTYLDQMPNETAGTRMYYFYMARNVLLALLMANGLMSSDELDKEFERVSGNPIYDDKDWIYELAEIFKEKYQKKRNMILEDIAKMRTEMRKERESQNQNQNQNNH